MIAAQCTQEEDREVDEHAVEQQRPARQLRLRGFVKQSVDKGGEGWRTGSHHVREHHRTGPQTVDLPGSFVQRLARKKDKQGMFPALGHVVVLDIRIDHTVTVLWDYK